MSQLAARNPPRRRRRPGFVPFVILGLVALLPALALLGVQRWADGQIDDNEAAPTPDLIVEPPLPADPLTNGMLSLRRLPSAISRDVNLAQFRADVAPFLATPNERSCVAISVDGLEVGSQNADLAVIPASTEKLIVAAAALDVLGPDHTFTTRAIASTPPVDGVLAGDLVLLGGGDPLLSSDWYPTSNLELRPVTTPTSLDELADRVQAAGVTTISGAVLGDGSRYDDEFFAPAWGSGVAGLEAGPYDALMANDARVLGEDQRGSDPNAAAAREFTRLLRERGITVAGEGDVGSVEGLAEEPHELALIESAPLTDVVAEMLTNSDNNTAELLVKEIGMSATGSAGATRQAGLDVMKERLTEWGIDVAGVVLADGSGLSVDNRLTCRALLGVLQRGDVDGPIGSALAVAGESGTLSDVFVDSVVAGRLRGKTGTLNNPPFNADPPAVKGLAGYLPVDGGGAVEYVLILNGPTISDQAEYRPVWDEFVSVIDRYPSGPSPAELGLL
jgi:serine-type D-Ala-D-Ala carboxypeptidase/endopeptidase (penicillin-binding protein 4)